jgi:hypothetical protein
MIHFIIDAGWQYFMETAALFFPISQERYPFWHQLGGCLFLVTPSSYFILLRFRECATVNTSPPADQPIGCIRIQAHFFFSDIKRDLASLQARARNGYFPPFCFDTIMMPFGQ